MDYKQFREKMMIAIDFGQMSIEEIEEHIQDLYTAWKLLKFPKADLIKFCKEQITGTRDDSCMWLSPQGMELLRLSRKIDNHNPFPVAGSRI